MEYCTLCITRMEEKKVPYRGMEACVGDFL